MKFKFFKIALLSFVAVEILSFFSYASPILMNLGFFAILATTLIFSFWKLEYGVYFLLAELFLGGKGYLLNFHGISLRIAIFCVIMGVWAAKVIIKKQKPFFLGSELFKYYLVLSIFVLAGAVIGFLRGNQFSNIFLDVNGWFYFLIIFPIFESIKDRRQLKNILDIFLAAITAVSLKTIGLFLIFAQSGFDLRVAQAGDAGADSWIFNIYKWIRNSGVGEITPIDGFYRIFFQAHIFVMIGFFILLWILAQKKGGKFLYFGLVIISSTLFISFSRSLWVGVFAGSLVFLWLLIKQMKWREITKFLVKPVLSAVVGILIVFVMVPGIFSAFGGRISSGTGEAASVSRINLLPKMWEKIKDNIIFGSGFGATIVYETKDPRQLEINPSGEYETYAFEWGYLDIWMKIGIFGLATYLLLIYKIFKENLKIGTPNFGLLCALVALCATNMFSPYLNHPLGIGVIVLIGLAGQSGSNVS